MQSHDCEAGHELRVYALMWCAALVGASSTTDEALPVELDTLTTEFFSLHKPPAKA